MRTDEEIKEYLNLYNHEDINKIIETAKKIERKYPQIQKGTYGYGLQCDFDNSPFILEDEDLTEMKEIERIDGIVVYEIIDKER